MNKEGAVLAARILTELEEISKLVFRIEEAWKKAKKRTFSIFEIFKKRRMISHFGWIKMEYS